MLRFRKMNNGRVVLQQFSETKKQWENVPLHGEGTKPSQVVYLTPTIYDRETDSTETA